MASLPLVEIVDPKGSGERRTLNVADFDPAIHTRWADREIAPPPPPFAAERRPDSRPATVDRPGSATPAPAKDVADLTMTKKPSAFDKSEK